MSEFEQVLLGGCIRFKENVPILIDGLKEEDLSSPKHRAIFRAIKSLVEHKASVDILTLQSELKAQGVDILTSELIELQDSYFEGIDLDYYVQRIKTESERTRLYSFLLDAIEKVKDPSVECHDLESITIQRINEFSQLARGKDKDLKKPETFFDQIRMLYDGQSVNEAIPTGWKDFDDLLAGLRPNELTVLTGETASGKTTWATNLGYLLSKKDHPVLIASFEMKPVPIIRKMIQMAKGRPFRDLPRQDLEEALALISRLPLYFIDVYGEIGISELRNSIYYAKRRHGIKFVILDHLHFFLKFSGDHERQAIDSALRDIKEWAMQLDLHIILIVHPTKLTYDNSVVRLNDLKGSSGLKQIPDNVLSIWRQRGENDLKSPTNEIILYILKVRDDSGNEGKVILTFDKRSQSYSDSGPGEVTSPAEGKVIPESSSSSSRKYPSGRDWVGGYDS